MEPIASLKYGDPKPLSKEDRGFMVSLRDKVWSFHCDRLGGQHGFPKGPMEDDDLKRVIKLIEDHCLPCVLSSGPYGGLFFHIYDHSAVPGVPPEHLFTLDEGHFNHFGLERGFDKWQGRFDAISVFTHNDKNRQMVQFYKLPEPEPSHKYEY